MQLNLIDLIDGITMLTV